MLRQALALLLVLGSLGLAAAMIQDLGDFEPPEPKDAADLADKIPPELLRSMLENLDPEDLESLAEFLENAARQGMDLEDVLSQIEDMDEEQLQRLLEMAGEQDIGLEELAAAAAALAAQGASPEDLEELLRRMEEEDLSLEEALEEMAVPLDPDSAGGGRANGVATSPMQGPGHTRAEPDRNGEADDVVCHAVFDPWLVTAKRWLVYDRVLDGYQLGRFDTSTPEAEQAMWDSLVEVEEDRSQSATITGQFPVNLGDGLTPIYSVAPDQTVMRWRTDPLAVGVDMVRDPLGTYYLRPSEITDPGKYTLTLFLRDDSAYHSGQVPDGVSIAGLSARPEPLPPDIQAVADDWLAKRGLDRVDDLATVVEELQAFFGSFGEGPIDPEEPDFFTALVESQNGCCRHRALGFLVAAHASGIPSRVVVNDCHAFAEVFTGEEWIRIDLGGCGDYNTVGAEGESYTEQVEQDRRRVEREAPTQTDPEEPPTVLTQTRILDWSTSVDKQDQVQVDGLVEELGGDGLAGADVEVYLNTSKDQPGRQVATFTTDAAGSFAGSFQVPDDLPPADYQLVAGFLGRATAARYEAPSWSDPLLRVHDESTLSLQVPAVASVDQELEAVLLLTDSAGAPLADQDVRLQVPTEDAPRVGVTDDRGRWVAALSFAEVGVVELSAFYNGSDHATPANATATVQVLQVAFVAQTTSWDVDPGDSFEIAGTLTDDGVPLAEHALSVALPWGTESVQSDVGGEVRLSVQVPDNANLGSEKVVVRSTSLDQDLAELDLQVRVTPTLQYQWPGIYVSGSAPELNLATLHGDTPLPGVQVEATSSAGTTSGKSGQDGVLRLRLPVQGDDAVALSVIESDRTRPTGERITATPVVISAQATPVPGGSGKLRIALTVNHTDGSPVDDLGLPGLGAARLTINNTTWSAQWGQNLVFQADPQWPAGDHVAMLQSDLPGHSAPIMVQVGEAQVRASLVPDWWPWILPLLAVPLLVWGIVALRRRGVDPRRQMHVALRVSGRPWGHPLAALPDEPVVLEARSRRAPDEVEAEWSLTPEGDSTPKAGKQRGSMPLSIALPGLPEGSYTLQLRLQAGRAWATTRLQQRLEVAPWDEQVGRTFDWWRENKGLPVEEGTTARGYLRQVAHGDGLQWREAAAIVEKAAYTASHVEESDWIRLWDLLGDGGPEEPDG